MAWLDRVRGRIRGLFGGGGTLGLELGTQAVAAVELDDHAPPEITAFGASPHPGQRGEELGLWLRRWIPTVGASTRTAHAALVEGDLYHFLLRLPEMTEEERGPAVRRELRQQVSVPIDRLAYTHEAVGTEVEDGTVRQVVLAAAAERRHVENAVGALEAAGLQPGLVTTVPLALVRAAEHMVPTPGGMAMAYLAPGRSFLVVFQDGVVEMVREFSLHGDLEMKERDQIIEELTAELRRSFLYFGQRARGASIERLILCGTLPQLRDLTGPLIESLNVEVELYDAADAADLSRLGDGAVTFRSIQPALAVALGAASLPENRWNLLSEEAVREPRRRALSFAGAAAAGVVLLLLMAWYGISYLRVMSREGRLDELQSTIAETQVELEEARATQRNRQQFQQRRSLLEYRTMEPPLLAAAMQSISHLVPDQMVFRQIQWQRRFGEEGRPYWDARIDGLVLADTRARSQAIFARFYRRLRQEPEVQDVDVVGSLSIGAEDARRDPLAERREELSRVSEASRRRREQEAREAADRDPLSEAPELQPTETSVGFTISVKLKTVEGGSAGEGSGNEATDGGRS